MFLHRIHLDPQCREARRDLADPYQLHATLCRAFCLPNGKCPPGEFLWRLEPETDEKGHPRILVQSRRPADWPGIGLQGWLSRIEPAKNLNDWLNPGTVQTGRHFRFRLRANPCVTRNGKRLGLLRLDEQKAWIARKGGMHGFSLPQPTDLPGRSPERADVWISQEQMLRGRQHAGNGIRVYSVLYEGLLTVSHPQAFLDALRTGIGHGKALGLGLLSVAPATRSC